MDVDEFIAHYDSVPVSDVLAHYASPYYDPVKAREYYLRTRELKGRHSTKGMSETQQQAWSYAKNQISEQRKAELKSKAEAQKVRLEELRNKAEEVRDRLSEKLKGLLESLKLGEAEKIEAEKVPEPKLLEIPTNASPKVIAYLQRQNGRRLNKYAEQVADAEAVARDKREAQSKERAAKREVNSKLADEARTKTREERVRIGNDLKSAVATARAEYEAAKKETIAKYDAAKDTEYNNIKSKLPGAAPKAKKAPKKKAAPKKKKRSTEEEPKEGETSK